MTIFKENAVCDSSKHFPESFPQGKSVTACYDACKKFAEAGTAIFSFSDNSKKCVCWGNSKNQQCTTTSADDYPELYGTNPTLYKY